MVTKFALGVLGVAIIAIVSLGYAGYSAMNPQTMTVTAQQYVTNTQVGATTITSVATMNNQAVQTVTAGSTAVSGAAYQMNCGAGSSSYGCNWPYTYDACQGTGVGNGVTCDGYLEQGPSGCVILAVPTDTVSQPAYNHYALQNLPSSYPSLGSWVVVKGGLTLSGTPTPTSASAPTNSTCPTNSISVSSIQQTNMPYPNP